MKIGIIGGGVAGLTTAWLLDQECDVTLFEQQEKLGGHADTVHVDIGGQVTPIDAGFEFFSDTMFPYLNRLLSILQVPLTTYPMTYTFYTSGWLEAKSWVIPPFGQTDLSIQDSVVGESPFVSWQTLLSSKLFDLIDFIRVVNAGARVIDTHNTTLTIEEFIEGLPLSAAFKNDFLYPFLASGWGAPLKVFKAFAAYDIMMWCVKNKPSSIAPKHWIEVQGGTCAYIQAVAQQLTRSRVKLACHIIRITYNQNYYIVRELDGTETKFDHLVIATNAYQAIELLKNIPNCADLRSILGNISYFHTVVAIHGDERLMPADKTDWSVINVRYTGIYSAMSIYKPWKSRSPIFRSWVTIPISIYRAALCHAGLPSYGKRAYFQVEKALDFTTAMTIYWLTGLYTYGVDSH